MSEESVWHSTSACKVYTHVRGSSREGSKGECRLQLTPLPKHAITNPCAAQGDPPLDPVRLKGEVGANPPFLVVDAVGGGRPRLDVVGVGWDEEALKHDFGSSPPTCRFG